jgi:2-(1,2-epoxy-1,2-dihydrophenyl)acetyl-CoA isomerase
MATPELKVEVKDKVGVLTLNRPDKLNAFTHAMMDSAIETLERWAADPAIGCVVVTGEGRAFCAGGDVSAMQRGSEIAEQGASLEAQIDHLRRWHRFPWLLHEIPKVTIAALNGPTAGGGLGLALSCDLRIASDAAKLGTAYARVGYGGDFGTTWQLTRLVGEAKAKELFFLPDMIDAAEALRIGLVNRVVPAEGFWEETLALARRIASGPLVSYRYMKANVNLSSTTDFRTMLDRETETHLRCGQTEDHIEGVHAFMEKREPTWKGR